MLDQSFIGIIPARYHSKRFPGKAIASLAGMPVICHVYHSALKFDKWKKLIVATDDSRVANVCREYDIPCIITSMEHKDCIDRAAEVMDKLTSEKLFADRYLIIQGDEPFFDSSILEVDYSSSIINFYTKITDKEELDDPNVVKVVVSKNLKAIYFSRYCIPHCKFDTQKSDDEISADKQIGIYAFSAEALRQFRALGMSYLEGLEGIGLLRCLENDIDVHMRYAQYNSISIDTKQDLIKAETMFSSR